MLIITTKIMACNIDADCGVNSKCSNHLCHHQQQQQSQKPVVVLMVPGQPQQHQCQRHMDCFRFGLYFECHTKKHRCVKSDHKICASDEACKKNLIHRRCIRDRCSI